LTETESFVNILKNIYFKLTSMQKIIFFLELTFFGLKKRPSVMLNNPT